MASLSPVYTVGDKVEGIQDRTRVAPAAILGVAAALGAACFPQR
jgi:hypothetical protein